MTAGVVSAPGGSASAAASASLRPLTVLLGDDRHDVVIDENLSLGEVLILSGVPDPGVGGAAAGVVGVASVAGVAGVASGGVIYPLDQTVAQARLAAGSVLTPVRADAMARLDRSTLGRRRRVTGIPAWGPEARDSSGTRAMAPTAVIPTADVASVLAAANAPGAGSSRADMAARMPSAPAPGLGSGLASGVGPAGRATGDSVGSRPLGTVATAAPPAGDPRPHAGEVWGASAARDGKVRSPIGAARDLAAPLVAVVFAMVAALSAALAAAADRGVDPRFGSLRSTDSGSLPVPADTLTFAAAGLLLVAGMVAAQSRVTATVRHVAPVLGAAAGAVGAAVVADSPLVVVLAAAGGVLLVTLAARPERPGDAPLGRVWTAYALLVGVIALGVLVLGGGGVAVACFVLATVALAPNVLPAAVVDVDDTVLLDIARLSVTSWSPRERRGSSRGPWRIDNAAVGGLVARAKTLQSAALVGLAALSLAGSVALGVDQWPVPATAPTALLLCAAVAPALTARSFRRASDRALLRAAALPPFLAGVLPWVGTATPGVALATTGIAVVVGIGLAYAVRSSASGRPSLAAGRAADMVQSLAVVSALPLALWTAGVLDWARGLLS